jgi:hypothetical protein
MTLAAVLPKPSGGTARLARARAELATFTMRTALGAGILQAGLGAVAVDECEQVGVARVMVAGVQAMPGTWVDVEAGAADVSLPAAVTVSREEYVQAPRGWTEQAYHNLIYFNQAERGGHFAAGEQPQLFSEELRAAFRTLR